MTRPVVLPGPTLAEAVLLLLWVVQLDTVDSQGRDWLNGGRR
jgi:hypothetical protein